MRIRQVKPAFWADKRVAVLPKATQLAYIGLWMLADDAGWIESFDVEQAAAELFPHDVRKRAGVLLRERDLSKDVDALAAAGRVVVHDCRCLEIPKLPEHQRVGGRLSLSQRDAHRKHTVATSMDPEPTSHEGSHVTVGNGSGTVGNGTERNGKGAPARQTEDDGARTLPPFEDLVAGRKT